MKSNTLCIYKACQSPHRQFSINKVLGGRKKKEERKERKTIFTVLFAAGKEVSSRYFLTSSLMSSETGRLDGGCWGFGTGEPAPFSAACFLAVAMVFGVTLNPNDSISAPIKYCYCFCFCFFIELDKGSEKRRKEEKTSQVFCHKRKPNSLIVGSGVLMLASNVLNDF